MLALFLSWGRREGRAKEELGEGRGGVAIGNKQPQTDPQPNDWESKDVQSAKNARIWTKKRGEGRKQGDRHQRAIFGLIFDPVARWGGAGEQVGNRGNPGAVGVPRCKATGRPRAAFLGPGRAGGGDMALANQLAGSVLPHKKKPWLAPSTLLYILGLWLGMDESGFPTGYTGKERVIGACGTKTQHKQGALRNQLTGGETESSDMNGSPRSLTQPQKLKPMAFPIVEFEATKMRDVLKAEFMSVWAPAYTEAFDESTVRAAFEVTGVIPFNPNFVTEAQMKPSVATSTRAEFPMPQPSPVRAITNAIRDEYDEYENIDPVLLSPSKRMRTLYAHLGRSSASSLLLSSPKIKSYNNPILRPVVQHVPRALATPNWSLSSPGPSNAPYKTRGQLEAEIAEL
ncbi:hypothetical protein C8R44DRAFT_734108 [Mycena epipterygia]|nr:hypothetical protein C8R44DRAFT_734108 [Mycena epipterygia]